MRMSLPALVLSFPCISPLALALDLGTTARSLTLVQRETLSTFLSAATYLRPDTVLGTLPPSPTPLRPKGIRQVAERGELCPRTSPLGITLSRDLDRQTQFPLPNASPEGTPESLQT